MNHLADDAMDVDGEGHVVVLQSDEDELDSDMLWFLFEVEYDNENLDRKSNAVSYRNPRRAVHGLKIL